MKKVITVLLIGLMMLGSVSVVFAEEPDTDLTESVLEDTQEPKRLDLLKEFTDEIHRINALKIERNQLQIQKLEKHDNLVDLIIAAKESGDEESLKAFKEIRQQLEAINNEMATLHEQAKASKQAFKEAMKSRDKESAQDALDSLINIHTSINEKIMEKVEILNDMIEILS